MDWKYYRGTKCCKPIEMRWWHKSAWKQNKATKKEEERNNIPLNKSKQYVWCACMLLGENRCTSIFPPFRFSRKPCIKQQSTRMQSNLVSYVRFFLLFLFLICPAAIFQHWIAIDKQFLGLMRRILSLYIKFKRRKKKKNDVPFNYKLNI